MDPIFAFRWLEYDAHPRAQDVSDPAQGAEGMALVTGGLKPTDLLLGGLEEFC